MEGVAAANDMYKLVSAIGIIPSLVLAAVVIFFLFREQKKNNETMQKGMADLKTASDKADAQLLEQITKLNTKIDCVKVESVQKEQYYSDWGGWRTEFKDLRDLLNQYIFKEQKNGN
jgi:hypothetical protein